MSQHLHAFATLAFVALLAPAPAQDDLHDRVELDKGRELRGRVFSRLDGDEILLQRGTHRQRVDRREVVSMETVGDRVR